MERDIENKHLQRADLLIEIGRYPEAINQLNKCLSITPNNYYALCKLSLCFYELNDLQNALEFAKRAAESNPTNAEAYGLQSLIFRISGNHEKSLEAAENCIKLSPFSLYAMQNLAYSQINLFRLEDARKTIDQMLRYFPNESQTYDVCGYLALKQEDWKNAEEQFQRALQIEPTSAISLNNVGVAYINQAKISREFGSKAKNHQKAIKYYELAVKSKPTFLEAQNNLKFAQNTNFYLGSKMFWAMIKNCFLIFGLFFLLRITFGVIPLIINFFIPYKPQFFYLGLNFIFIGINIITFFFVIRYYYLKSLGFQMQNRFENSSKLNVVAFILLFTIPQFLGSFFFAFVEINPPAIIWLSYILFVFGIFFMSLKLFQYIDNKEIN